jgi:extracellular matrix protein 14
MILDIWSMTSSHVDIRIPKTSIKGFLSLLPSHISQHEPIITNLRAAVDYTYPAEKTHLPSLKQLLSLTAKSESSRRQAEDIHFLSDIFFSNYQSYSTVNQWLYLLESLRPELVQVVKIGESFEGKEILGLVIKGSRPARFDNTEENVVQSKTRAILMHGAQHAREWISVSTVCYIAYQMIAGYYTDESVRKLVDEFEWKYSPSTIGLTVVYFQC